MSSARAFIAFIFAAALASAGCDAAQADLSGRWHDNAPGADPIGLLVIGHDTIAVGRKIVYDVQAAGAFGDGQLFKVTGSDRKTDPEGCGADGKVHFLAVRPLPQAAPGVGKAGIRVFFYSGTQAPTPESIEDDIALCSVRPFDR